MYTLDLLLFLFGTSLLFHVQFELLLPDLHIGFSRGRSGGLVFPSLSGFSPVYCDPHSQGFDIVNKADIDVFLELSCCFNDPVDFANYVFTRLIISSWYTQVQRTVDQIYKLLNNSYS